MELPPDPTAVWLNESSLKHHMDFYQNVFSCFPIKHLLGVYYLSKKANSPVSCLLEIYSQGNKTDKLHDYNVVWRIV